MNKPPLKPGWKSSEFWLTFVSFIFSGLYLVGLLDSNSQKEDLITESSRGVEAVILIIGQLTVLFRYIKGRTEIKKTWWNLPVKEDTSIKENKSKSRKKKNATNSNNRTTTKQTSRTSKKQPRKSE